MAKPVREDYDNPGQFGQALRDGKRRTRLKGLDRVSLLRCTGVAMQILV
jgi:hypothetical protein